MRENKIYEEYSDNREYKFEVYQNPDYYEVWIQKRMVYEYMGKELFDYCDISDYMHRCDTLNRAVEMGGEYLK